MSHTLGMKYQGLKKKNNNNNDDDDDELLIHECTSSCTLVLCSTQHSAD